MQACDDFIVEVIKKLPNECAWLDYKIQPYKKVKLSDYIKDVIAMLNSEEAYGKDKCIIFGITNNRHRKGITNFCDDSIFQELLNKITPRPEVSTGNKECGDVNYGYIFIPKENIERAYEVSQDYICEQTSILKGQAFIRKGSSNFVLTSNEREKIILKKYSLGVVAYEDPEVIAINSKMALGKSNYCNPDFCGVVKYNCANNNGRYEIGQGAYKFAIHWYTVNNGVAHIRGENSEKIGYRDNCTEFPDKKEIIEFDFTSFDRRVSKDEVAVLLNTYGNFAVLKLNDAKSKSHGALHDEVTFEYRIIKTDDSM